METDPIEPEVNADKTDAELRAHQTVNVKAELETASKTPLKPVTFGEKLEKPKSTPVIPILISLLVLIALGVLAFFLFKK